MTTSSDIQVADAKMKDLLAVWERFKAAAADGVAGEFDMHVSALTTDFGRRLDIAGRRLETGAELLIPPRMEAGSLVANQRQGPEDVEPYRPFISLDRDLLGRVLSFLKFGERGGLSLSKTCKQFHQEITPAILLESCQLVPRGRAHALTGTREFSRFKDFFRSMAPHAIGSIGLDTFVDIMCRKACFKTNVVTVLSLFGSIHWDQISITSKETLANFAIECWEHLGLSVQDDKWILLIYLVAHDNSVRKKLLEYTLPKWENDSMRRVLLVWRRACQCPRLDNDVTCFELLINHDMFWHALKSHCLGNENEDELREYKAAFSEDDRNALLELMGDRTSVWELRESLDFYY